jgi:hypothetical protein
MATVFRVLLWALVLIAPGGILLAPFLAGYEMRRRAQRSAPAESKNAADLQRSSSIVAVASAR